MIHSYCQMQKNTYRDNYANKPMWGSYKSPELEVSYQSYTGKGLNMLFVFQKFLIHSHKI